MKILVNDSGSAAGKREQSTALRFFAHIISFIFHPLFISIYLIAFLLYVHPTAFAGIAPMAKFKVLLSVLFNTVFLTGFAVFLMWRLKLIKSLSMPDQRERIYPLVAAMIFYFWAWYVSINLPGIPVLMKQVLFGSFLGICAIWLLNIAFKVSMHAVGMGGLILFFLLISLTDDQTSGLYISLAFLIAGLVITARMIVSDHTKMELYSGLAAGAACQLIAWYWYL